MCWRLGTLSPDTIPQSRLRWDARTRDYLAREIYHDHHGPT
jgi:hypothetical protein